LYCSGEREREREREGADTPAADPAVEILPGFGGGVAADEQLPHAVEAGSEDFAKGVE
jgi:hypothetical protein